MADTGQDNPAYESNKEEVQSNGVNGHHQNGTQNLPGSEKDVKFSNGNAAQAFDEASEVEAERQRKRDRDPLRFCKWITERPKTFFGLTLFGHIFFFLVTFALIRAGVDVLVVTFERLPLDIENDEDFLRGLAWGGRMEDESMIARGGVGEEAEVVPERTETFEAIEMMYEEVDGNVFTKANLLKIKETEDDIFSDKTLQDDFSQLKSNGGDALAMSSIMQYFDGTYKNIDPVFDDPDFDNIVEVLHTANTKNETKRAFQYFLGANSEITDTVAKSSITRSVLYLGGPLEGYLNKTDREDEQGKKLDTFLKDNLAAKLDKLYKNGIGNMDYIFSSGRLIGLSITNQVLTDMSLALGSIIFIFLFMWLQTGSLWVTAWAIFSIIASFVSTNLIYRFVFDYRYFGVFNILGIFIILGIGADDVFVFFDTWKETGHYQFKSLGHRMSHCYRKASLAMLFTSLTTAIAFIVSATSPFLGVASFGVFSGILVFVNYISVIVFFPCVVVMYHVYFEKFKCCCCCPKSEKVEPPADGTQGGQSRKHPVVRFMKGPYFNFVTHKIARWVILAFFLVLITVFVYFATTIKVNEEQVKFLPESTNVGKWLARRSSAFKSQDDFQETKVVIAWGLKQQDRSACHHSDSACDGVTVWDDAFDLNSDTAQNALLDFCSTIRNLPKDKIDDLKIKKDIVTGKPDVVCFVEVMEEFMMNVSKTNPGSVTYPIQEADAVRLMDYKPMVYNQNMKTGFNRWFEIGVSYWMYGGFEPNADFVDNFQTYNRLLGEAMDPPYTIERELPAYDYYYGTRLRFAAVSVTTTLKAATLGYPQGLPVREAWEKFVVAEMAKMPEGLKGGFQCTDGGGFNLWHWLKAQEVLSSSAVQGIIIGICLALPILILATHNIIVGILATATICLITVSVVGVIPMAGWKLGLLESLNLVLVVGLAVDYVVHLAEGYSRSPHKDRLGRTRDMLEEVGISVLSGAVTTLGASMLLLFAVIMFFTQFGIFMFCTIGFSIIYALGLFVTVLGVIGPQNEFGSLKPLYRKCKSMCCKSNDSGDISNPA